MSDFKNLLLPNAVIVAPGVAATLLAPTGFSCTVCQETKMTMMYAHRITYSSYDRATTVLTYTAAGVQGTVQLNDPKVILGYPTQFKLDGSFTGTGTLLTIEPLLSVTHVRVDDLRYRAYAASIVSQISNGRRTIRFSAVNMTVEVSIPPGADVLQSEILCPYPHPVHRGRMLQLSTAAVGTAGFLVVSEAQRHAWNLPASVGEKYPQALG